jgi:5'-nucleotidase
LFAAFEYPVAMLILVTNDDGITAPGITALYESVKDLGQVEVVAPETAQSAMGHAISVQKPMLTRRVQVNGKFEGWSVDGRPADCVKLAMEKLLPQRPDFVLSGINAGANTGMNVLYSGTVAGALEGAFFGVPSLAFSLEVADDFSFTRAGEVARAVFEAFIASRPSGTTCLNVNIPALGEGWPRGVRVCPQCVVNMKDKFHDQTDESGSMFYWLDGRFHEHSPTPDSDITAVGEGFVSITPLRFDLTDREQLAALRGCRWPVFQ